PASTARTDVGLTLLRVVTGIIFAAHGGQKLFSIGLADLTAGFAANGVPMAAVVAPAVALVEFFGGIALIVGLLTRLAAIGVGIVMVGAIVLVHMSNGFFLPAGFEFTLLLLTVAALLAITGARSWSADGLIAARA